jgi:hypothetical protein
VGATILSIDDGDDDLGSLVHDRLVVPTSTDETLVVASHVPAELDMDTVQHFVSVAAGEEVSRSSLRDRIAQMLDRISGPAPRG